MNRKGRSTKMGKWMMNVGAPSLSFFTTNPCRRKAVSWFVYLFGFMFAMFVNVELWALHTRVPSFGRHLPRFWSWTTPIPFVIRLRDSFVGYLFGRLLSSLCPSAIAIPYLTMRQYTGSMDISCISHVNGLVVLKINFQDEIVDSLIELRYALQCPVSCLRLFRCGCAVNLSPSFRWGDVPGIV